MYKFRGVLGRFLVAVLTTGLLVSIYLEERNIFLLFGLVIPVWILITTIPERCDKCYSELDHHKSVEEYQSCVGIYRILSSIFILSLLGMAYFYTLNLWIFSGLVLIPPVIIPRVRERCYWCGTEFFLLEGDTKDKNDFTDSDCSDGH